MTANYTKYLLNFKRPSGTSRGVMTQKETWFIALEHEGRKGIGECGILRGLSVDDVPNFEEILGWTCLNINLGLEFLLEKLKEFPSIQFGLEMAFKSLESKNKFTLFPSSFTSGKASIPINGLIWMGSKDFMKSQIKNKISQGFKCLKLKIGALDFKTEINLLKFIRSEYSYGDIQLRVDANGAFSVNDALEKLNTLSDFQLHSIEQPIKQGQIEHMAALCEKSLLPIALDEELIGVFDRGNKEMLLQVIKPHYIILKPSFIGGFQGSNEWIDLANKYRIGWWITSALESNVGLNAIAQWTFNYDVKIPQGLGTGALFTNNFTAPLQVDKGMLRYDNNLEWNVKI